MKKNVQKIIELQELENEAKKNQFNQKINKAKFASKLKRNRDLIKKNKGNFVYRKRLFLFRWWELFKRNFKRLINRYILIFFR